MVDSGQTPASSRKLELDARYLIAQLCKQKKNKEGEWAEIDLSWEQVRPTIYHRTWVSSMVAKYYKKKKILFFFFSF